MMSPGDGRVSSAAAAVGATAVPVYTPPQGREVRGRGRRSREGSPADAGVMSVIHKSTGSSTSTYASVAQRAMHSHRKGPLRQ